MKAGTDYALKQLRHVEQVSGVFCEILEYGEYDLIYHKNRIIAVGNDNCCVVYHNESPLHHFYLDSSGNWRNGTKTITMFCEGVFAKFKVCEPIVESD